ncbi:low molecular weight phosphatase family protein [Kocuria sp. M1R5S2]|uniref:arsenate-mycothiol transferase ArsC n=1 Tax=Kocuria rhizosphaerae TaxID=3376285 RepID=UPI0037A3AB8E
MNEQTHLSDRQVLRRTAEPLAARYAGVFFPELVHRYVAECHATLARTARIHTYLAPMAVHDAATRLATLAGAKDGTPTTVPQVLFVDAHDTGPAQLAAGLLTHHVGTAAVARSAGIHPGTVVDPVAVEVLAQHGVEPAEVVPKPVTDEAVRAADWVVTFGVGDACPVEPETTYRDWPLEDPLDEARGPGLVAELEEMVHALWSEISASCAHRTS